MSSTCPAACHVGIRATSTASCMPKLPWYAAVLHPSLSAPLFRLLSAPGDSRYPSLGTAVCLCRFGAIIGAFCDVCDCPVPSLCDYIRDLSMPWSPSFMPAPFRFPAQPHSGLTSVPDDEDIYEEESDAGQEQRCADGRDTRMHGRSGLPEAREERRQDDNGSALGAARAMAAVRDTGSGELAGEFAGDPAGRAGPGEHAEARRRYEESLTIDRRAHGGADRKAERVGDVAAAARVASRVRKLSASPSNIHLIPEGGIAQKPGASPIATPVAAAAGPKVRQKDASGRSARRTGEESRAAAEPLAANALSSDAAMVCESSEVGVPVPRCVAGGDALCSERAGAGVSSELSGDGFLDALCREARYVDRSDESSYHSGQPRASIQSRCSKLRQSYWASRSCGRSRGPELH